MGEILDGSVSDQMLVEDGLGMMIASPGGRPENGKEGGRRKGESTSGSGGQEGGHMLGEWSATALCGNDLLSSCLYTIGLVTQKAGKIAPLSFIFVSLVLYLIKSVYAMAVLSFPHNGGSYNVLAHVAPRPLAAFAATLSIISYIATCVVSAVSACDYLSEVVDVSPVVASVLLLIFFAALVLTGLKESSSIAFGIFLVHCMTLLMLAVSCFAFAASEGFSVLWLNIDQPYPRVQMAGSEMTSSLGVALFLGFSSAMLGVSGYETTVGW
jgi:amino acid transporter